MTVELGPPGGTIDGREVVLRVTQALLALVAALVAAWTMIPLVAGGAAALGVADGSAAMSVAETVGQYVGFAVAAVMFAVYAGDRDLLQIRVPTRREAVVAVGGAVFLLLAGYAILTAFAAVGLTPSTNRALTNPPLYFLAMIPLSFLTTAVGEEFVFRGVIQGELRRALGPVGAIVGASLLFGLVHFPAGAGTTEQQLVYVVVTGVLSLVLGGVYEYTDNLTVPIFVHGAYNAVQFAVQYLETAGV
ncbi:CPBP family intramembrane glutamic endopeptidase [Halobaculum rubrum]|uniref:CPBP family intramembrane glutamic endopeptidase n=1 Tax=Halobaculum rubrum TaxID=2872158 RepID=UPI001CA3A731|nr:CPBP family intramembrane glutamic endopeptidase [Halobaculum rubrum]QZX98329.1 CPBP family intramembrane metalloprotease [Halobaculum rubrum]